MNRILTGFKFDIKALNLNKFYSDVQNELGIKKSSLIEMGVEERVHHRDKKRVVTTTQVAAGHEFGNSFTPPRPFLSKSANVFVNGDFSKDVRQDYTYLGSFLKRLARKLYETVIECFMSGGFGQWAYLTEKYKQRTGRTEPPLVDTTKLMSSVYVRYEGYTVSGRATGGEISSSELFVVKDTKKDVPKINKVDIQIKKSGAKISKTQALKQAEQFKQWKKANIDATINRVSKYQQEKKSIENTEEAIREFYSKRVSKRFKKGMSYYDLLAKRSELEDLLVNRELRRRKLI